MIDAQDKQTITLPFEEKRGRGRPKTGKALTPAEKQRAYRERHKAHSSNTITNISAQTESLLQEIEELKIALGKEVAARKKAELASRKTVTGIDAPGNGIWSVEFKVAGTRGWVKGSKLVHEDGKAWSFEKMRKYVDNLSREPGRDRAVRDDGLIYEPKGLK